MRSQQGDAITELADGSGVQEQHVAGRKHQYDHGRKRGAKPRALMLSLPLRSDGHVQTRV